MAYNFDAYQMILIFGTDVAERVCYQTAICRQYAQDEVTSHNLWLRYDRHFVAQHGVMCGVLRGEDLVCYSNKTESVCFKMSI